jgi:hypothetical protein
MNTTTYACSKFPHPDDYSRKVIRDNQVARIRAMSAELKRLDPGAAVDAMRDFVIAHIDDLDAIEITLRQTLEGLDAADEQAEYTELRNQ